MATTVVPARASVGSSRIPQQIVDVATQALADVTALEARAVSCLNKSAADGAAGTASAEHSFLRAKGVAVISSVHFVPDAALTADATNLATLIVRKRDGAGGAAATVATLVTDVAGGNWAAFTPKSLGAITNGTLAAGNVLTFEITKGGTGVVVPAGQLVVSYT